MIPVVVDTSVFIRYLIRPSRAIRFLIEQLWIGGQVEIVTAPDLLNELHQVLARESMQRFIQPDEAEILMDALRQRATLLPALGAVPPITADAKDDKFVACAIIGQARYLISTDQDILALGLISGVACTTPEQFLVDAQLS
jgi:putative PIN family toxin of toxin-antitoxin system